MHVQNGYVGERYGTQTKRLQGKNQSPSKPLRVSQPVSTITDAICNKMGSSMQFYKTLNQVTNGRGLAVSLPDLSQVGLRFVSPDNKVRPHCFGTVGL